MAKIITVAINMQGLPVEVTNVSTVTKSVLRNQLREYVSLFVPVDADEINPFGFVKQFVRVVQLVSRNNDEIRSETKMFWTQTQASIEQLCGKALVFDPNDFLAPGKQKELFSQIKSAINDKFRYGNVGDECLDQHSSECDLQF